MPIVVAARTVVPRSLFALLACAPLAHGQTSPGLEEPYVRALCEALTTVGGRSRIEFAAANRLIGGDPDTLDVNNDGTPDLLYACDGGSIRMPCTEYKDAQGNALEIWQGFEWNTYTTFGESHFRYDGKTFIYHSYDDGGSKPAFVSYITPQNREYVLCEFDNEMANKRRSGDAAICLALERGAPVDVVALPARPSADHNIFGRFETHIAAFGPVDIDNDGKPEDILELHLQSGAGRGCDWNYFELATPDGRALLKNEQSRHINELQDTNEESDSRRNCGVVANRLLRHAGKIYYETNVDNAQYFDHEVRLLEGGRVQTVCGFDPGVATTVRSIKAR
jgi:hypothetical protein